MLSGRLRGTVGRSPFDLVADGTRLRFDARPGPRALVHLHRTRRALRAAPPVAGGVVVDVWLWGVRVTSMILPGPDGRPT